MFGAAAVAIDYLSSAPERLTVADLLVDEANP
jgi:hypothetical protein